MKGIHNESCIEVTPNCPCHSCANDKQECCFINRIRRGRCYDTTCTDYEPETEEPMNEELPEPSIEPKEPTYITADCGDEVYQYEIMVTWEGKTLCPECFMDKVHDMTIEEVAVLMDVEYQEVKQ